MGRNYDFSLNLLYKTISHKVIIRKTINKQSNSFEKCSLIRIRECSLCLLFLFQSHFFLPFAYF